MTRIFNRFHQRITRKQLRREMPDAEAILWSKLKSKQRRGQRFRRQYSIGRYVVDFYCPSKKLVIEIDGPTHENKESRQYDHIRSRFMRALELRIIRFSNSQIYRDLSSVLEMIDDQLH